MSTRHIAKALAAVVAAGLLATPVTHAAEAVTMDGAPKQAEVRFESRFLIPPAGYSLSCIPGFIGCSLQGAIELATKTDVPVERSATTRATYGLEELPFSVAEGTTSMSFGCEGVSDPFVSKVTVDDTIAGELYIDSVKATPGFNSLAVVLDSGGITGSKFPQEVYERSDGGCGSPAREHSPTMGQWYRHFYLAHRTEQLPSGNRLELRGLAYKDGVFTRTYNRGVNITEGSDPYTVEESTRIEVEPKWCRGRQNRISSATANGESLGLDGSSLYAGQVITAPPKTKIRLGDGSSIELEKGGRYAVERCEENLTDVYLGESVTKFLAKVKKVVGGSEKKFEVTTRRMVIGVRGTVFSVSYNKPKQLTRVAVEKGSVSLKGINGAKGKVILHAGEVGVQRGTKAPRIVNR